jgi:hypothetical protein
MILPSSSARNENHVKHTALFAKQSHDKNYGCRYEKCLRCGMDPNLVDLPQRISKVDKAEQAGLEPPEPDSASTGPGFASVSPPLRASPGREAVTSMRRSMLQSTDLQLQQKRRSGGSLLGKLTCSIQDLRSLSGRMLFVHCTLYVQCTMYTIVTYLSPLQPLSGFFLPIV